MLRQVHAAAPRVLVVAAVLVVARTGPARADAVSGTWSGALESHANYFVEPATKVVMPRFGLELESPAGVDLDLEYLVDVISSASVAQTSSQGERVFTEYRQQASAAASYELDAGAPLELSGGFTLSVEDDYTSRNYALGGTLSPNERNTTLGVSASFTDDTVESNVDASFERDKRAVTVNLRLDQVLSPVMVLSLGYSVSELWGFLANPYRRALVGPQPFPEEHPDSRTRHAGFARLSYAVKRTGTGVHLTHRAYVDSWEIGALSPSLRVAQPFGGALLLSARYRYYTQSSARFYRTSYPVGWDSPITNDPKMREHVTHTFGGRLDVGLALLSDGPQSLDEGSFIVTFDRYLTTSVFGDGYIVTAGTRLPL